jgi:hypothetical protein
MAAMKRWLGNALVMAGPLACSAQAEPDYRGEPLAVVRGAIVTGEQSAPSDVDAAVVWVSGAGPDQDGYPIARVRVHGEFPAQFTIEVFDPPPDSLPPQYLNGPPDAEPDPTSIGVLAAIAPDSGDRVTYDEILGVWLDGGVEYFRRDANGQPNDAVQIESERRKLPPTQGYHLFRETSDEQIEGEFFRCQNWDLCIHSVSTYAVAQDTPDSTGATRYPADIQALFDSDYAKCLAYLDHPATCTSYGPELRTAEEQAETRRCSDLETQTAERAKAATDDQWVCSMPWQYVENPEGFDYPVNIELGSTFVDWMNPRYRK